MRAIEKKTSLIFSPSRSNRKPKRSMTTPTRPTAIIETKMAR